MFVKLTESMMENAIAANPEAFLGEAGLELVARQYRVGSYIFDLLFQDRRGAKLIVEIQLGTLDRNHTYKILDYYDEYKAKRPGEFIELMVVANRIPYERRQRLNALGISWREIPIDDALVSKPKTPEQDASPIGTVEPSHATSILNTDTSRKSVQRGHEPMTDASGAFKQYQEQTSRFLAALENIDPPVRITVNGRNVRQDNPGNWFSGFSPLIWGRKVGSDSGIGFGSGVGVGYGYIFVKNVHGDHFMRLSIGIENPLKKEFRDTFKEEVSTAVKTQQISLPQDCRIWPDTKFADFRFRGTSLLECQPIPLRDNTWSIAIQNLTILNKGFNELIAKLIREYKGRGAFSYELKFD